jgi:hypothetical protein
MIQESPVQLFRYPSGASCSASTTKRDRAEWVTCICPCRVLPGHQRSPTRSPELHPKRRSSRCPGQVPKQSMAEEEQYEQHEEGGDGAAEMHDAAAYEEGGYAEGGIEEDGNGGDAGGTEVSRACNSFVAAVAASSCCPGADDGRSCMPRDRRPCCSQDLETLRKKLKEMEEEAARMRELQARTPSVTLLGREWQSAVVPPAPREQPVLACQAQRSVASLVVRSGPPCAAWLKGT